MSYLYDGLMKNQRHLFRPPMFIRLILYLSYHKGATIKNEK